MDEVVKLVREELDQVRTGRARPALVESVKVEAYGDSSMEIRELANITAPDSHSLLIKPWDSSVVGKIEKALTKADLGALPVVDNDLIRIKIPALTTERRQELVKAIKQRVESGRGMLRQIRIELKKEIDTQKNTQGVSEDDIHTMYDKLQSQLQEYNDKLAQVEEAKEKELMEI